MPGSSIDQRKYKQTLWRSWFYSSLALLNMFLLVVVIGFISIRVGGPRLFLGAVIPLGAVSLAMFLFSENIVNIMLRAREPDLSDERHARFVRILDAVSKKAGLWIKPRGYIVSYKDLPNAVAYGTGFPFFRAVAVTEELVDIMSDEKLEAVVAHEVGHLTMKDVGIMTFVGVLAQVLDNAVALFLRGGSVFGGGPFAYVFGYIFKFLNRFVFGLMRFALSQEREYSADAYAANLQGTSDHMIGALRELQNSRKQQGDLFDDDETGNASASRTENPLEHLMVSHPGIGDRIKSLKNITVTEEEK